MRPLYSPPSWTTSQTLSFCLLPCLCVSLWISFSVALTWVLTGFWGTHRRSCYVCASVVFKAIESPLWVNATAGSQQSDKDCFHTKKVWKILARQSGFQSCFCFISTAQCEMHVKLAKVGHLKILGDIAVTCWDEATCVINSSPSFFPYSITAYSSLRSPQPPEQRIRYRVVEWLPD